MQRQRVPAILSPFEPLCGWLATGGIRFAKDRGIVPEGEAGTRDVGGETMKRTSGTARTVVTGMLLMGTAFGMFGDMKLAATNQSFPRVPRTEQEQMARGQEKDATPAMTQGVSLLARRGSGETDPCIPIAPVTFSVRGAVIC